MPDAHQKAAIEALIKKIDDAIDAGLRDVTEDICKRCGEQFFYVRVSKARFYCSEQCRTAAHAQYHRRALISWRINARLCHGQD